MPSFDAEDLSVVIPTRGRWKTLGVTLDALRAQTAPGFETIVVVDGTDEQPPELPGVKVIRQEHAGPGVARNTGVAATDRALVLFIGDDMVPSAEFVGQHLKHHRERTNPEVGVLGRVVWHPTVPSNRLHRWLDWSGALFDYSYLDSLPGNDAGWERFYSCNVSLKRELFTAAGGFDPDFEFDYEDLDFGWRLGHAGLKLVYERAAVTQHLHPYDWAAVERRYQSRAPAERLMARKHEWFRPWFHGQMRAAASEPPASRLWPLLVDAVPRRPARVRRAVERRADLHYRQRLARPFLAAWAEAAAVEEESRLPG